MSTYEGSDSSVIGFMRLVVFFIVAFIVLVVGSALVGTDIQGAFENLPFTKHALESHNTQRYNAVTIYDYMFIKKECTPTMCIVGDTTLLFCPIDDKFSMKLVVGKTVQQVITGHKIETSRIDKECGNIIH